MVEPLLPKLEPRPHADKAYDTAELRQRVRDRGIAVRYDRKAAHFLAFLTLAAALTCLEKLTKCATRDVD
ncbi:hypothetical protein ABZ894_14675 [Nocardia beijingensis]|uniref:hypothetical protein n=1 Tax=Nocardia beijingensis TaxID=95162 RepID=UPI003407DB2E